MQGFLFCTRAATVVISKNYIELDGIVHCWVRGMLVQMAGMLGLGQTPASSKHTTPPLVCSPAAANRWQRGKTQRRGAALYVTSNYLWASYSTFHVSPKLQCLFRQKQCLKDLMGVI